MVEFGIEREQRWGLLDLFQLGLVSLNQSCASIFNIGWKGLAPLIFIKNLLNLSLKI
jgi:hypothetical protein